MNSINNFKLTKKNKPSSSCYIFWVETLMLHALIYELKQKRIKWSQRQINSFKKKLKFKNRSKQRTCGKHYVQSTGYRGNKSHFSYKHLQKLPWMELVSRTNEESDR